MSSMLCGPIHAGFRPRESLVPIPAELWTYQTFLSKRIAVDGFGESGRPLRKHVPFQSHAGSAPLIWLITSEMLLPLGR